MHSIRTSWNEIQDGAKETFSQRKVSSKLMNGVLKTFALLWAMFKKSFLALFYAILIRIKKILPLPTLK